MVDIRVSGLVKSFDLEKRILDGLSFQVDSGERVGLLGRNGAGKTTVFRMLTGELEPDEGEIQIAAGRRVGLISQIPVYPEGYTVEDVLQTAFARMFRMKDEMDALALRMEQGDSGADTLRRYGELNAKFEGLGGWDTETAVNKVANGLSIPREMRQREFACLSGGEKTRVNLGRLILEDTDILLLDEPTNHLDLQATEWLEGYLRRFRGTVLTISHDRYFLDRTVTRIIEIQDGKAEFYSGNYSFYAIEKERRYQERMKQYLKEQAKIAQLEKAAEQMHLWAFMGNDALHKRAFSMEKRIERMRTTAKPTKARRLEARFQSREFKGDEVLQIKGVSKAFGEKRLFEDVYLRCEGGERIALLGENGTGKELVARWLHEKSARAGAPFVEVNCAAIPSELIESELFGHEKGAFTSAIRQRKGKFEQANGGTLFMDEIGDMSLSAQAKVLRALQESRISRVGSDRDIEVNVRVVAATNKNLREEIQKGNFREDLYHRLAVIVVRVPPLREHAGDIPALVEHFIRTIASEYGSAPKPIDADALAELQRMPWSGNIRELRNVIERLIILSGDRITARDVKEYC